MCQENDSSNEDQFTDEKLPKRKRWDPTIFSKPEEDKPSLNSNNLDLEQKELREYLYDILFDSLCKCRLIARGEVFDSSVVSSNEMATLLHNATIAGGLIPFIGKYCIATALVTSAIYAGTQAFSRATSVKRAEKINAQLNGPDAIIETCKYLSAEIPKIYAESIAKLNLAGKHRFAECAVFCMLHYVMTNEGKESDYFSSTLQFITNLCVDFGISVGRYFNPENFPINDPQYIPLRTSMLNALIFFKPSASERTQLEHKPGIADDHYYFEGILTTGIKTIEGNTFNSSDAETVKYGYRLLTNEYAEKLASIRSTSPSCVIS